jgi:hypothetical protein
MSSQSTNQTFKDWVKERLDEINGTLTSFEQGAQSLQADARTRAEKAMADIRAARDDFQKSMKEHGEAGEAAVANSKNALEAQWIAFEAAVPAFLEAAGQHAKELEAAFCARAEAQRKAWHEAIEILHKKAEAFSDNRRKEAETAVKQMKVDADAAKAKLDKLEKAGGESWAAMKSALTETRTALDKARQAVYESFQRVA